MLISDVLKAVNNPSDVASRRFRIVNLLYSGRLGPPTKLISDFPDPKDFYASARKGDEPPLIVVSPTYDEIAEMTCSFDGPILESVSPDDDDLTWLQKLFFNLDPVIVSLYWLKINKDVRRAEDYAAEVREMVNGK
jgi:hypothetical protein